MKLNWANKIFYLLRKELLYAGYSTSEINCCIGTVNGTGDWAAIVAALVSPGGIAYGPRQDALERREEVEDCQSHKAAVIGDDEPSGQGSSIANSF